MSDPNKPVLIVDDSDDDYEIIASCLLRAGVHNKLVHLRSGAELFEHLKVSPQAAMIMLDVNLPGLSGLSVLARIRKSETIGLIPVVMLSTSDSPRDINLAHRNGANSYLVKPGSLAAFERLIAAFSSRWLKTAEPTLAAAAKTF